MKDQEQLLWIGEEDLTRDAKWIDEANSEFHPLSIVEELVDEEKSDNYATNRRDFLKYLGFGIGAATVAAGCEAPIKKALPYVIKPDAIVPGVATYYASSFVKGGDYNAILVKTREGRPIKIEGNDLSPLAGGGTSAKAQALVLGLYDTHRFKGPSVDGESVEWKDIDSTIKEKLAAASNIRILSHTVLSPSLKKAVGAFGEKYTSTKHVSYDPMSCAAMLRANEANFGEKILPSYNFAEAEVIVSFDADFLGSWISPVEFAHQFAERRKLVGKAERKMSRHYQAESRMSISGSNADHRILVKPSEQGAAIAYLYNAIVGGGSGAKVNAKAAKVLDAAARDLKEATGKSMVISGSNNTQEQMMVNAINNALGNYGRTISFAHASLQRQGDEQDLIALIDDMEAGRVDALIINDSNPAYDNPLAERFTAAMEKVATKISTAIQPDETTALCNYIAPNHHNLESWGDAEPKRGIYSLMQPTIAPLFDTRQIGDSLLNWAGSESDYLDFLKSNWEDTVFASQSKYSTFNAFWDSCLHDGVVLSGGESDLSYSGGNINFSKISAPSSAALEMSLFFTGHIGDGSYSTNPWLMEMPDPITRTVWGNYVGVPISFDGDRSFNAFGNVKENGQQISLSFGGSDAIALGAVKQFGQAEGTVSLALGYGRTESGTCANDIGYNAYHVAGIQDNLFQYYTTSVDLVSDAGSIEENFANVQHHHTFGVKAVETSTGDVINADEAAIVDDAFKWLTKGYQGSLTKRSIIRGSNLDEIDTFLSELEKERAAFKKLNEATLYPFDQYTEDRYTQGHHWGMHVDMNACIGCGACTVACMAENNVPVVGKKEVSRHHEMTWLRIDRYYYGDVESPNVVYQPMMCQHCDNAPCENVCPVNATNHSSEGLNQMAYNRCVGTRYCANNCPFKVRRFNWLDYTTNDLFPANEYKVAGEEIPFGADNLTRMVLNPDVTVRTRGVIEKCSFCVQRLQEGKLAAKQEGRRLEDRDVKSACASACPTGAITFGDRNNPEGDLNKKYDDPLNFIVLEEVNVQSSVRYASKIINKNKSLEA